MGEIEYYNTHQYIGIGSVDYKKYYRHKIKAIIQNIL